MTDGGTGGLLHRCRLLSSVTHEALFCMVPAGMGRREVRTKVALGVFAVVLVGIIIGLIVWMVGKNQ